MRSASGAGSRQQCSGRDGTAPSQWRSAWIEVLRQLHEGSQRREGRQIERQRAMAVWRKWPEWHNKVAGSVDFKDLPRAEKSQEQREGSYDKRWSSLPSCHSQGLKTFKLN